MSIEVKSPAFSHGERIPERYTREADNVSPPLSWSRLPAGTQELAVIVDDPDAPSDQPFVHWVAYKIPAEAPGIDEGVRRDATPGHPVVQAQGRNSFRRTGYDGPAPPPGDVHHYHFHVYALDRPLEASGKLDKEGLIAAMAGHILDEGELVGTFAR